MLKVLFVAAEAAPFSKAGGLADVAGSLPRALRALGHDVRLVTPLYGSAPHDLLAGAERKRVRVPFDHGREATVVSTVWKDLPVYLLGDEEFLTPRDKIYGYDDDPVRFLFFCQAVAAAFPLLGWRPDVVHANDWHAAPLVVWLSGEKNSMPSVFTIHNIAYQGVCDRAVLGRAGLGELGPLEVEPPGLVNWMAQGIAHADVITTVSPTYAREITETAAGAGLSPLLKRRAQIFGILNGIDTEYWNPATDPYIVQRFTWKSRALREANKAALQRDHGLSLRADVPLLGMVTRLDPLKGIDLVAPAIEALLNEEVQFVLQGVGIAQYHQDLGAWADRFPENVRVFLEFDEALAHRIYSACDMFLMPSRLEPCGLGQMIAMRYGAIPVVHRTGGLADTVVDVDQFPNRGTGFVFDSFSPEGLLSALRRAVALFRDRKAWGALQARAMRQDFSWRSSAQRYIEAYEAAQRLRSSGP